MNALLQHNENNCILLPWWIMKINIPTTLTLFRVILVPFIVLAYYLPFHYSSLITAIIFIIASITDFFDGYLARKWQQTTHFGKFLDPVADKIMVCIVAVLIVEHFDKFWVTIPILIIISREILISGLREWLAEIGERGLVQVSIWGKIKTTMQMIALALLLWHPNNIVTLIGFIALYLSAALTIWSMWQYLHASRKHLLSDFE